MEQYVFTIKDFKTPLHDVIYNGGQSKFHSNYIRAMKNLSKHLRINKKDSRKFFSINNASYRKRIKRGLNVQMRGSIPRGRAADAVACIRRISGCIVRLHIVCRRMHARLYRTRVLHAYIHAIYEATLYHADVRFISRLCRTVARELRSLELPTYAIVFADVISSLRYEYHNIAHGCIIISRVRTRLGIPCRNCEDRSPWICGVKR